MRTARANVICKYKLSTNVAHVRRMTPQTCSIIETTISEGKTRNARIVLANSSHYYWGDLCSWSVCVCVSPAVAILSQHTYFKRSAMCIISTLAHIHYFITETQRTTRTWNGKKTGERLSILCVCVPVKRCVPPEKPNTTYWTADVTVAAENEEGEETTTKK